MTNDKQFKTALKRMPSILCESFDPLGHKTVADLVHIGRTALDLHDSGEDGANLTPRQYAAITRFINSWMYEARQ